MEWTPWFEGIKTVSGSRHWDPGESLPQRPSEPLVPAVAVDGLLEGNTDSNRTDLWRYPGILPFETPEQPDLAAGGTPLLASDWLSSAVGVDRVYIKDEGRNPTGSIADRDMAIALAASDAQEAGLPSAGRSAVAAAAAGATAGVKTHLFVPSRAPFAAKAMINVHGGDMSVVGGRYDEAVTAYADAYADEWLALDVASAPFRLCGRQTVYLEILEALDWVAPDRLVIPTGTGVGAVALSEIASRCVAAGLVDTCPEIVIAQPAGCAPLVDAFHDNKSEPVDWPTPDTICGELEVPNPPFGSAVLHTLSQGAGSAISVPDPAALEAAVRSASEGGIAASPAGGVAIAAATDVPSPDPNEEIVIINPSAGGLEADLLRSHLMGKGE